MWETMRPDEPRPEGSVVRRTPPRQLQFNHSLTISSGDRAGSGTSPPRKRSVVRLPRLEHAVLAPGLVTTDDEPEPAAGEGSDRAHHSKQREGRPSKGDLPGTLGRDLSRRPAPMGPSEGGYSNPEHLHHDAVAPSTYEAV